MKLSMSDDEIRVSYNTAKDQKAQIQVLAELNATTPAVMAAKLRELGCDVPVLQEVKQKPLRAKEVLFDENRARALFAEGKSDLEIAEMLGISVYQFGEWRRKNGMKRHAGGRVPGTKKVKQAPCKAQPPMPPEAEMPAPEPAPETAAPGSQAPMSTPQKQTSAEALGRVLLDLAKRYPGLTLTVNGTTVRSVCLNVRVLMDQEITTSTLNLEVG